MSFLVPPKTSALKDFKGTQGTNLKTLACCLSFFLPLEKQSLLELFCCKRKEGGEITKAHNSCHPPASTPSAPRSSPKYKNATLWGRVSGVGGDSETQFSECSSHHRRLMPALYRILQDPGRLLSVGEAGTD